MTEIGFYQLQRTPLEKALPRLLEKVLATGRRAVVLAGSPARVEALTHALWVQDPNGFLPHGSAEDGNAERQPVWLTVADENPNRASVLVLTDGAGSARLDTFERCLDLFDGNDAEQVAAARARWAAAKAAGHAVAYWQQGEGGAWEKRA